MCTLSNVSIRSIRGRHGCRYVVVVVQVRERRHRRYRHWLFCCVWFETVGRTGRWYPLDVGFYGLAFLFWFSCFDFRHGNVDHVDHCPWTFEALSPSFSPLPKPSCQAVLTFTLLQLGRWR